MHFVWPVSECNQQRRKDLKVRRVCVASAEGAMERPVDLVIAGERQ